jgi:formate hydrogenlyase subunit 6/NADH:ubiquinone oxidoreductase subunit I
MCGRCEAFCPTGALKTAKGDGEVALEFRMSRCMGCNECRELCPEGAIYYEDEIELERLVDSGVKTLMKRQLVDCPKCPQKFFPELNPDGCPNCKRKRGLDDRIGRLMFGEAWEKEKTAFGR